MVALKQGSVPDVIANKLDHLLILTSGTEQYLITCTNKKYKFLLTTTLTISGCRDCPYGAEYLQKMMEHQSGKDVDDMEQFIWCDKVGGKIYQFWLLWRT